MPRYLPSIVINGAFKDGVQYIWDSTSIKLINECMQKYKLKMIDGWQSPFLSVHLRFGQVYATALEHYHKYRTDGVDPEDALSEVVSEAMYATWDYEKDEDGALFGGKPWDSGDPNKTRETLIRTIIWYVDHFANDGLTIWKKADGTAAVELSFKLPVDDGLIFSGHLDRVVKYNDDLMVMDQKTTKATLTPRYFEAYNPDIQMSMYTFAGNVIFQSPVKGVIIDAAQIAVGFSRFERGMTFRTQSQLTEWYDETMQIIHMARHMTKEGFFPMNRTACQNYGGCEFRRICSKSPEHRINFLRGDFNQGPSWDPSKER